MIGANSLTLKLVILRPGTRQALAFLSKPKQPHFQRLTTPTGKIKLAAPCLQAAGLPHRASPRLISIKAQLYLKGREIMSSKSATVKRSADILRRPFTAPFLNYVGAGILVGLVTGLVVGAFRWIIDQTLKLLTIIYPWMASHPVWLIPYVLGSLVIVFLIGQIIKVDPLDLVGSGVPQIKAILLDKHHLCW